MCISNELFQSERDETPSCQFVKTPNDITDTTSGSAVESVSAIEKFSFFMRFLAPPSPSTSTPGGSSSIAHGAQLFRTVGCALRHTPTLQTGDSTVAALRNKNVNLYSDLLTGILAHRSAGSEANAVVNNFRNLSEPNKQDVLNFLRSL